MPSGDGLIVRLRATGGILSAGLAADIARWSRRWGNRQIDLTNRANLQLRGFSAGGLDALHRAMGDAGLLDDDPAAEAVRNVIASPLAGVDPAAMLDIRSVTVRLEERLARDPQLHALPGKFGFAIDDGGRFGLDGVPADVWFVAGPSRVFSVRLAGSTEVFESCGPEAVPDVAAEIARTFLAQEGARRMRAVKAGAIGGGVLARMFREPADYLGVHSLGSAGDARMAGTGPGHDEGAVGSGHGEGAVGSGHDEGAAGSGHDGRAAGTGHDEGACAAAAFLGVGLPFGRIDADDLARLAASVPELRLTPWRAILVPLPFLAAARALAARLPADAFILDPDDPRRRVAACPGAPACPEATTQTRADAAALGARLPRGRFLHVSGCAKGCAHPGTAPITLVGRAGRYDLIRDGSASAIPAIRGLTVDQVKEHLA